MGFLTKYEVIFNLKKYSKVNAIKNTFGLSKNIFKDKLYKDQKILVKEA